MEPPRDGVVGYRIAFSILVILTIAYVVFVLAAHHKLPERIPVHFDLEGNANRTADKAEFLIVNLALAVVLFLSFGVVAILVDRIPARFINLPNKDYWLAPERRKESIMRFNAWYLWMGNLSVVFMLYVSCQVYRTGIGQAEKLQFGWLELGLYFLFLTFLCLQLYRSFFRKRMES